MSCPFCEREQCDRDCAFCDQGRAETGAPYRRTAKEWRELGAKQLAESLAIARAPHECTCAAGVKMHKDGCPELLPSADLVRLAAEYYTSPIWMVGIQRALNELIVRHERDAKIEAVLQAARELRDGEGIEAFPRSTLWAALDALDTKEEVMTQCPNCKLRCKDPSPEGHLCSANHEPHCDIRTSRDGWDADCSCSRGQP